MSFSTPASRLPNLCSCPEVREGLCERYGAVGAYIGQKRTAENFTNTLAMTFVVSHKLPLSKLRHIEPVPKRIYWNDDSGRRWITTDVVESRRSFRRQVAFNPGDVAHRGGRRATVASVMDHVDFGPVLVSAGHFARAIGGRNRLVEVHDRLTGSAVITTKVVEYRDRGGVDYALLAPTNPLDTDALNNLPVRDTYNPSLRTNIGQNLKVLTRGDAVLTTCRGLDLAFYDRESDDFMTGLIGTDPVTVPGDSGCALVDSHFRLWGILIGVFPIDSENGERALLSVFMPIKRLLALERFRI